MNIDEFAWLYKECQQNIPTCKEALAECHEKYIKHCQKHNKCVEVFMNKIFEGSEQQVPQVMEEEKARELPCMIVLVHDREHYQVETYEEGANKTLYVNGGYGKELWDEQTAKAFIETVKIHCTVTSVTEESTHLSTDFEQGRHDFYYIQTSWIRAKQHIRTAFPKETFAQVIKDRMSETVRKELDFFEVTLDMDAMYEKNAWFVYVQRELKKSVDLKTSFMPEGHFLLSFTDRENRYTSGGIQYEYCEIN